MADHDRFEYKPRDIRELLLAAYSERELRALIDRDELLRPLRVHLADSDAIVELVLKVIKYCERIARVEHLLALVAQEHPAEYARFTGKLRLNRGGR